MASLLDRLQHAWDAFSNPTQNQNRYYDYGLGYGSRPDRIRLTKGADRTIITAVLNRLALDVCATTIVHAKVNEDGRFVDRVENSSLNDRFFIEANIDQTGRAFFQDVVLSMFDDGCVAIVPVITEDAPRSTASTIIHSYRTGKILEWMPKHVRVEVYNEQIGKKQEIVVPKEMTAIIENPFYSVMNERNSTLQRLVRKLAILDVVDEQSGSGKLDLIIQLPYTAKTDARKAQSENRRKEIEAQLVNSKYGIAYTDGTEKITQLNRSVENNLMHQIEYLTSMLYSQLCISEEILNGSAKEEVMVNYYSRTVEPIVAAIADEMNRKFLSKTARSQGQRIVYFRDPFKLVPVSSVADMADKFTRNEIMSSNEFRQVIGLKPVDDAKADELRNKNLNPGENQEFANTNEGTEYTVDDDQET